MSKLKFNEKTLILKKRIEALEKLSKDLGPQLKGFTLLRVNEIDDLWEELKKDINQKIGNN